MVGGFIIDIHHYGDGTTRLWCVDRHDDECAVIVRTADVMPKIAEEIWWQADAVLFDQDRRRLEKVGYSYQPADEATS